MGIGIGRGGMTDRWLHVDKLILISKLKIYVFLYSGHTDRQTDGRADREINLEKPISYLQNLTIMGFLFLIAWLHHALNFQCADTSTFCMETLRI